MEPYEELEMELILFQDIDIIASSAEEDTETPWMDDSLQIPGIGNQFTSDPWNR